MVSARSRRRRDARGDVCARSAAATCRCSLPACRFSRKRLLRDASRSMNRRSTCRSAAGRTKSAAFEVGRFDRIRARQGLVGRRSAGQCAARTISTPCATNSIATARSALRGFHRQELSVPRGIHRARLGDALRLSRRQGRPRQARVAAGRDAVRRAGLVHQHAARQVQGPARARSADHARSISNGPTRPSCTAPMRARIRRSRIPT